MSADVKARPIPVHEAPLYYSAGSLRFARDVLSDLEDHLKEKALGLTLAAGRNTVTEDDMRQAATDLLEILAGDVEDSSMGDA